MHGLQWIYERLKTTLDHAPFPRERFCLQWHNGWRVLVTDICMINKMDPFPEKGLMGLWFNGWMNIEKWMLDYMDLLICT